LLTMNCSSTDATCGQTNGSATATANGGTGAITYNIGGTNNTTGVFTALASGTYTITATDSNGCTETCTVTVGNGAGPTVACAGTNPSCNNVNDGQVLATVSGGTAPYTYVWNNSATSNPITNLSAGTYTVTVTDANSCTTTCSATLTAPAGVTNNPSCS